MTFFPRELESPRFPSASFARVQSPNVPTSQHPQEQDTTMTGTEKPWTGPAGIVDRVASAAIAASSYVPEHWPDYIPPRLPPAASQAPPMSEVLDRVGLAAQLVDRLHRREQRMARQLDAVLARSLEDTQARGVLVVWHTDGLGWDVQLSGLVPPRTIVEVRQEALEAWRSQGQPLI